MVRAIPPGDNMPREICSACGYVHYSNPKVQVAVLVTSGDKVLWMRRAEEPRAGYWEIPGGFMELGETLRQAAVRETLEETGVRVIPCSATPWLTGSIEAVNEVHVLFRARAESERLCCGPEAVEADWFCERSAPWGDMAFPQAAAGLRLFYRELCQREFGVYYAEQRVDGLLLQSLLPEGPDAHSDMP